MDKNGQKWTKLEFKRQKGTKHSKYDYTNIQVAKMERTGKINKIDKIDKIDKN